MDPNNNQPLGTNPVQQPAAQQPAVQPVTPTPPTQAAPVAPPPAPTVAAATPQNVAENSKKGGRKIIILIILILILMIGIGVYIIFAKNQLNNIQKTSTNTTAPIPQSPDIGEKKEPSISKPTSQDDLDIESPETDLQGLDAEVKGL